MKKRSGSARVRGAAVAAALAVVLTGCIGQTSEDGPAGTPRGESGPPEPTGNAGLGDYQGLCGWTTPEEMEAVFGRPMDAVGFRECRVVAEGDFSDAGIYHVRLEQTASFDDLEEALEANARSLGEFRICGRNTSKVKGMRVATAVTCQNDGEFGASAMVEVQPGRLLESLPFEVDTKEKAEAAAKKFAQILTSMAGRAQSYPMINEVMPGKWVEILNPTGEAVDVSGYQLVSTEWKPDSPVSTMTVPDGTRIKPGGRVVVALGELGPPVGDWPVLQLLGPDGGFRDAADLDVDKGEVTRRNGDGGTLCPFGSENVTKGAPNPPRQEHCDE